MGLSSEAVFREFGKPVISGGYFGVILANLGPESRFRTAVEAFGSVKFLTPPGVMRKAVWGLAMLRAGVFGFWRRCYSLDYGFSENRLGPTPDVLTFPAFGGFPEFSDLRSVGKTGNF